MKRFRMLILGAFWLVMVFPAYAQEGSKENVKELLKAVVKVRVTVPDYARSARTLGTEREGSGVLIDDRGHILTIGYLILEAETLEVIDPDGKPITAQSIAYDHITGFGVLKVEKPMDAKPMQLGKSSEVNEGDPILVATHGGEEGAMGARIISRKEFAGYWEYLLDDAIFTAPAYANFGGAALIDKEGQLVGIGSLFTQIVLQGIGTLPSNMFVPIDLLKPLDAKILSAIVAYREHSGVPGHSHSADGADGGEATGKTAFRKGSLNQLLICCIKLGFVNVGEGSSSSRGFNYHCLDPLRAHDRTQTTTARCPARMS